MPQVEIGYLKLIFSKIFGGFEFKVIVGLFVGILSFLFDNVYVDSLIAIVVLIVFDFITGLIAAKKNDHEIKSAKVFRSVIKIAVYFMLISAGNLAELATQKLLPIIDETMMAFLALTELISILENTGKMGYAIPQRLLNQLNKYRDNQ